MCVAALVATGLTFANNSGYCRLLLLPLPPWQCVDVAGSKGTHTHKATSDRLLLLRAYPLGGVGAAMSCAMPSTIAVLPTPASPISRGLCLDRRSSTCAYAMAATIVASTAATHHHASQLD